LSETFIFDNNLITFLKASARRCELDHTRQEVSKFCLLSATLHCVSFVTETDVGRIGYSETPTAQRMVGKPDNSLKVYDNGYY